MPYVNDEQRNRYFNLNLAMDLAPDIETKGDLEYLVFRLMLKYMKSREYRYGHLHDAVYGTIHSGEEFKRRYLDKRENEAMIQNGDID